MAVLATLGTGLFIGASQALAVGGPGSLLISYLLLSILVYALTNTVADVAVYGPVRDGTLVTNGYRYASRHFGFATGYLRWYTLALFVPYEITTAMVNVGLWEPEMKVGIRITMIILVMFAFNFLPEKAFRRSELLFTGLKLILTIGLVVFSIVLLATGSASTQFDYWRNSDPIHQQLATGHLGRAFGVVRCLLYSGIAFIFIPEQVVSRAEQKELSPHSTIHSLSRRDSLQTFALYLLSVLAMGLLCPSDDPLLTNYGTGAGYSPYLVAIRRAGIKILPIIATTGILLSSVASGRTFMYMASRSLHSLSENGHAPSLFYHRNGYGVPYAAVLGSGLFSLLAYMSVWTSSTIVFNWIMPVVTASGYLSWFAACVIHQNFQRATRTLAIADKRRDVGRYGTCFGMGCSILLLLANGLNVERPGAFNMVMLVPAYIGIVVFLVLYYGHQVLSPMDGAGSRAEEISLERMSERASQWWGRARANMSPTGEHGRAAEV